LSQTKSNGFVGHPHKAASKSDHSAVKASQHHGGNAADDTIQGAPARAIQELAGHRVLATTQRYRHLSPSAIDDAIRLLDGAQNPQSFGDMLETEDHHKMSR
jgi:integrase